MYFVPLSQIESVELLIHALRMAAGEADCSGCPAYRVCMKQCLTIAGNVEGMLKDGSLPSTSFDHTSEETTQKKEKSAQSGVRAGKKAGLKVVK